jgi:glycosyltransferase involved in cell wall biosynthesis
MSHSSVSCIVPVYNGERYLSQALDSIFAQSRRPSEIIVVDDGSTDGTAAVVACYGTQVRYLWQPNSGPATARNLGLSVALGEFVAFLDADDLWHREKLERQMARFEARPELDLCVTLVQNFWIPELREEKAHFQSHRFSQPLPGYCTQALLARRVFFDMVGPFRTALRAADDTDWFLRAAERKAVMECLADVLVYRRLHKANLSRTPLAYKVLLQVVKASLDRRRCQDDGVPRAYKFPTGIRRQQSRRTKLP